ncbi:hypothetical protein HAX54_016564 [Datura stramonium]|uniref:Ubiquitin-like protease family profile domain-containing protein n=1 Tax=Datura stramonium TaxID=4076 RepID=A0ABS8ULB3_DATST|nr:hypothetical protein [Datura stramonium]
MDVQPQIPIAKGKEKVGESSSPSKNKTKQQTAAFSRSMRRQHRHVVNSSIKKMPSIQPMHSASSAAKEEDLICEYINGYRLYAVVPWYTVDNVFIPINVKDKLHWVLVVLSFRDRCIYAYDSLKSAGHDVAVKHEIEKLSQLLPIYLSTTDFYKKKGITTSTHPRNCGIFVAAYAELLSGGEGIPNSSIDAELLRNRYALIFWIMQRRRGLRYLGGNTLPLKMSSDTSAELIDSAIFDVISNFGELGGSSSTFNKDVGTTEKSASQNIWDNEVGEAALNGICSAPNIASTIVSLSNPATPNTANPSGPVVAPLDSEDDDFPVNGSDESIDDNSDSENSNLVGVDDYGSDFHEEYIEIRAKRRSLLRRK